LSSATIGCDLVLAGGKKKKKGKRGKNGTRRHLCVERLSYYSLPHRGTEERKRKGGVSVASSSREFLNSPTISA